MKKKKNDLLVNLPYRQVELLLAIWKRTVAVTNTMGAKFYVAIDSERTYQPEANVITLEDLEGGIEEVSELMRDACATDPPILVLRHHTRTDGPFSWRLKPTAWDPGKPPPSVSPEPWIRLCKWMWAGNVGKLSLRNWVTTDRLKVLGFTSRDDVFKQAVSFRGLVPYKVGGFRWTPEFIVEVFQAHMEDFHNFAVAVRDAMPGTRFFGISHLRELEYEGKLPTLPDIPDHDLNQKFYPAGVAVRIVEVCLRARRGLVTKPNEDLNMYRWEVAPRNNPSTIQPANTPTVVAAGYDSREPTSAEDDAPLIAMLDDLSSFERHVLKTLALNVDPDSGRLIVTSLPFREREEREEVLATLAELGVITSPGRSGTARVWAFREAVYNRILLTLMQQGRFIEKPPSTLKGGPRVSWLASEHQVLLLMTEIHKSHVQPFVDRFKQLEEDLGPHEHISEGLLRALRTFDVDEEELDECLFSTGGWYMEKVFPNDRATDAPVLLKGSRRRQTLSGVSSFWGETAGKQDDKRRTPLSRGDLPTSEWG